MPAPHQPERNVLPHQRSFLESLQKRAKHHEAAILALIVRAASVLAGFALTFLIGNKFGAAANGQFALISQTAIFLSAVGLLGLDLSVVRHFAKAVAHKAPVAASSMIKIVGLGLGLMILISLIFLLGGQFVWRSMFGTAVSSDFLLVLCVLLIARGGTQLLGGLLRSQHLFTLSQILAALTIPAVTAIALAIGAATSVEHALWVSAVAGLASMVVGAIAMRRFVGEGRDALKVPLKPMLTSALPLWGVGIALNIGDWYGLAVVAQMLGAAEVGIYRVAMQFSATMQIVTVTIYSIYSAKISSAFHSENMGEIALLARSATRVGTAAAVPLAAALILGSDYALTWIGPEFSSALPVIFILIIGQLALTLTGPCGLVLAMSGNERVNLRITFTSTVVLLASVPLAAHSFGLHGVAACASGVMVLRNLASYIFVRRNLGIRIWAGTVRQQ